MALNMQRLYLLAALECSKSQPRLVVECEYIGVFMRDGNIKGAIFGVVALGSLIGNVWLYVELKAERRSVAEALAAAGVANSAQHREVLHQSSEGAHELNDQALGAVVGRNIEPTISTTSGPSDQIPSQPKTVDECMRLSELAQAERLRDPAQREEIKNEVLQSEKVVSMLEYGDAAKAIGLNSEQMDRLYEIGAEQQVRAMERRLFSVVGSPPGGSGTTATTLSAAVAAEFGSEVAQKWADYRRSAVGRQMTYALANVLTEADAPLTAVQRQRLVETYTRVYTSVAKPQLVAELQNTGTVESGGPREFDQQSDRREMTIQRRFEDEAAHFLTEQQLTAVHSYGERALRQKRALRQSSSSAASIGLSAGSMDSATELTGC
jgi:hypothetical protein